MANTEDARTSGSRRSTYTADQIANGAKGLLDEVATGKVTGEEEYWSHTDLWDFQANVDGARVAFEGLRAARSRRRTPRSPSRSTPRFAEPADAAGRAARGRRLRALHRAHRREVKELSDAVNALAEPLSQLTGGACSPLSRSPMTGLHRRGDCGRRRRSAAAAAGGRRRGLPRAAGASPAGRAPTRGRPAATPAPQPTSYPFHGAHQAGIVTPAQDRLHFAAFDVTTDSRDELVALLQDWTAAAARMTQGRRRRVGADVDGPYDAPPDDTGEAIGLPPAGLTLTFGFGPALFPTRRPGPVRHRRPAAGRAARPAALPGRQPRPRAVGRRPVRPGLRRRSAGRGARDPQPRPHRLRHGAVRWSQLGFGRTSSTSTGAGRRPRNLFGFKDGTAEHQGRGDRGARRARLGRPEPTTRAGWLAGGSYLVARRINMTIETWDRQPLRRAGGVDRPDQGRGRAAVGRHRVHRAGLRDARPRRRAADPASTRTCGWRTPTSNDGVRMLRRGYNFVDGNNELGRLDAGLFFLAFVRDPDTQFIPIQTRSASATP